jgi:Flp pilus assembly protein TadD
MRSQDAEGAVDILERLVEADADNGRAWSILGYSYRAMHRPDEAIDADRRAVELPGSGPGALFNLGFTLPGEGDLDEGFDWILKNAGTRHHRGR